MARIEKTVFISYRRKDISWALAVYQFLSSKKYDVFFDYTSIPSGDFEQIIVSNIKARPHFILILTPTALDRCNEPGDWLRREIEIAIDEKRNIVPLFFEGFNFSIPTIAEKLTGKLTTLWRYNGLDVPAGYFNEAMERLRRRYLNVPLDAVIHPVSNEVQKVVQEEQVAANEALVEKRDDLEELVKPIHHGFTNSRLFKISVSLIFFALLGITGINLLRNEATEKESILTTSIPSESRPTSAIRSARISPKDGMDLLYIPAGEFTMGSNTGGDDEKPVHTVFLDEFWMDQTEVTNGMFAAFLNSEGNQSGGEVSWLDENDENVRIHLNGDKWLVDSGFDKHPVVEVSWFGAQAYCAWIGRRLPTEAEWEKAASWDDVTKVKYVYPWGNDFACGNGNFDDETQINSYVVPGGPNCDGFARTSPVGNFPTGVSPYGLLDMAGNVWEWVADWYDATQYSHSARSNPMGPEPGTERVIRGGSWLVNNFEIRSAYRYRYNPRLPSGNIGFRCASSE
jgi:formylglycine-generating enzyme required for sulfatase activity